MVNSDEPVDGGASSVESWNDEPACTFDPDNGFTINERSLDTLRWYSFLSSPDEDGETP